MEPLKNLYNTRFLSSFAAHFHEVAPHFEKERFLHDVFDQQWEERELKQRMRHIATVINKNLRGNFEEKMETISAVIEHLRKVGMGENSIEYMFFPDFVEQYGLAQPDVSLRAIEYITQFTSCEFALRPFLLQYPDMVMHQMLEWSKHADHRVRRFSSEGCRPRLPWAMAIPSLKKDPGPVLPILENLKNDPSEFVRRSVANNLNDIAKDHPATVLEIAKKWQGQSKETDWIIKHGCRTLLRKADPAILAHFGLSTSFGCTIEELRLASEQVRVSESLHFTFSLTNRSNKDEKLRVEYAIYYVKANGKQSKKLFKITENTYKAGVNYTFSRSQAFRDMTTRKHYPGVHKLAVVINGVEMASGEFTLLG